jgi:choline dehydrogenase-like flavoprotein
MVPKDVADIKLNGANQYYWNYTTVPQVHLDGLERTIEQGRVVGGGSVVNALVWQRGFQSDFDAWAKLGNVGWGWDDLVPYFMKVSQSSTLSSAERLYAKDSKEPSKVEIMILFIRLKTILHPLRKMQPRLILGITLVCMEPKDLFIFHILNIFTHNQVSLTQTVEINLAN